MAGEWARLTGPKGDRAVTAAPFAAPVISNLTLVAPLQTYDATWTTCRVVRAWDNLCFLEGLFRRSDNAAFGAQVIATLPAGFRPYARTLLNGIGSADGTQTFCRIDIDPDGTLTFQGGIATCVWASACGRWYAVQ
jgi:hypothetical protein